MGTRELTAKGREILERDQKIIEAALKLGIVGSEEGVRKGKWEMPKASDKIKALVDYNLLLKKAARVLAAGDDGVEKLKRFGFETPAVHVLPIETEIIEKNELMETLKVRKRKYATKAWINIRENIVDESGKIAIQKKRIPISTTGNTVSGHGEYSSEQVLRGIFLDGNWGKAYLIYPMTEADEIRTMENLDDPQILEEIERRRGLKDTMNQEEMLAGSERYV